MRCIECWSKVKCSCPTCRTPFKHVDSSNGERYEFQTTTSSPPASATESEYDESESNLQECESEEQYSSDDGFVVDDDVVQYDSDYASESSEDEVPAQYGSLRIEMYQTSKPYNPVVHAHQRERRRPISARFRSAIQELAEARLKKRKVRASQGYSDRPQSSMLQRDKAQTCSKFFHSTPSQSLDESRRRRRRRRRIQEACSDSDSECHCAESSGAPPPSAPEDEEPGGGGWLARLKSHVPTAAQ